MKSTFEKILITTTGVSLFFYLILVVYGFSNSWIAGLVWLLGTLFTLGLLGAFIDKEKATTKGVKVVMAVISIIALIIGFQFLPKESGEQKANPVFKIAKSKNEGNTNPIFDTSKFKNFQHHWTDSIVKDWKGKFIIGYTLVFPDTIKFEMSKEATKSIFSNRRDVLPIYNNNYEESCNKAFKNCPVKTVITFEANNELLTNSNIDQWMHPVVNNIGLRVYYSPLDASSGE